MRSLFELRKQEKSVLTGTWGLRRNSWKCQKQPTRAPEVYLGELETLFNGWMCADSHSMRVLQVEFKALDKVEGIVTLFETSGKAR